MKQKSNYQGIIDKMISDKDFYKQTVDAYYEKKRLYEYSYDEMKRQQESLHILKADHNELVSKRKFYNFIFIDRQLSKVDSLIYHSNIACAEAIVKFKVNKSDFEYYSKLIEHYKQYLDEHIMELQY